MKKHSLNICRILLTTLILISGADVFAQMIPDGTYYIFTEVKAGDGKMHAIDNSSSNVENGNNIHIWEKNGTNAQKWRVENKNGGIILHSGNNDNFVLDNNGSQCVNGNNIHLWEKNGTNAQLWYPEKADNGVYILRSAINRNYVIDLSGSGTANGNNIHLYQYNGTPAQKWYFHKADYSVSDLFFDALFGPSY